MALILPNNTYFKIDIDGNYIIYKNKASRNRLKKVTDYHIILKKYEQIIAEFNSLEYRRYHEKTNEKAQWVSEACRYLKNLDKGNCSEHYPLMEQYFADVDKTIPEILVKGQFEALAFSVNTIKDIYNKIKEEEIFGSKDQVKDA